MKFVSAIIVSLFLVCSVNAQNYRQVKIYTSSQNDIIALANAGIQFDHFSVEKDNSIAAFLNEVEFAALLRSGYSYQILIDDWSEHYNNLPKLTDREKTNLISESKANFGVEGFGFGSMGGYYTYNEILANLDSMRARYPNLISQRSSLGMSREGRPIWMVKISDNPNISENEPQVGFDALIHSREPQSMATLMYFMWYLLENYGNNPEVTYLVNNREIYCIPVVNPDGYEYNRSTNPSGGGLWRKNRRDNGGSFGVDLNRNYSFKWGYDNIGSSNSPSDETYRGPSAFSEPEALVVSNFIATKNIQTYFNMHSYQNAYLYPWGYINSLTPDAETYIEHSTDMCSYNNYVHGNSSQILGYTSNGSVRDWLYGEQIIKNKIFGYTLEIGSSSDNFWPPQNRIFPIAQINVKPNLYNVWVAGGYVSLKHPNFTQQYFNPGDIVQITPSFKNKGLHNSVNINVTLTSLSTFATINTGSASIDSISARGTASISSPLTFTIASNTPVEEKIKLVFKASVGSVTMSSDTVSIMVGVPTYMFIDTTNNPLALWTVTATPPTPNWEPTTTTFSSAPNSYTDSKAGNYAANATVTMTLKNPINLSTYSNPKLTFWTKYDIESNWDYGQVEITTNNGTSWIPLQGLYTEPGVGTFQPNGEPLYDGIRANWVREEMNLSGYTSSQVKLKFELKTDGSIHKDGWYVDDIGILVYTIIPVELKSFSAAKSAHGVNLSWITESELNNKGFEIECTFSGDLQNVPLKDKWKKIGFVVGSGTTTETNEYSFTDKNASNGIVNYRIKQHDFDGTFRIYGPIEIDNSAPIRFSLEQNYPNPFNPITTINYSITNSGLVQLKIFNALGEEVLLIVNEVKDYGSHEIKFDASSLPSGVYYYQLISGGKMQTKKMTLLR